MVEKQQFHKERGERATYSGVRYLTLDDVRDMALGSALLGSGGGGSPGASLLQLELALASGHKIPLLDLSSIPDDALIAPCAWVGAPTVSEEKLHNGQEARRGLAKLEQITGQKVYAVFPMEIGGSNGLSALVTAVEYGVPVVDCDGMGRAFPESQMVVFNVYGCSANPVVLTDDKGSSIVIETEKNIEEERLVRTLSIAMGGTCHVIDYPGSGYQMKQHAVRGTVSLAIAIGRSIRLARQASADPFAALIQCLNESSYYRYAGVLFDGKIVDLERNTEGGFAVGRAVLESFGSSERMEVAFQNENLVARLSGKVVATVPDILTFFDRETAQPVATERLRYGQRLKLVGVSVPPLLRTPPALEVFGPQVFDIEEQYQPIEKLNGWL